MKYETHIRIRITKDLNERLEKIVSYTGSKSNYIRTAIIEKVKKDENDKNRNIK
jgi:hypothetical protein